MRALQISEFGNPLEAPALVDLTAPEPGPGQVAVAMTAAPVNPSDLLLILGVYGIRPELPTRVGAEGIGRIAAVGAGIDAARVGELVMIVPSSVTGTWAEQVVVDADG